MRITFVIGGLARKILEQYEKHILLNSFTG